MAGGYGGLVETDLTRACERLEADLRARGSVLVAYSGGADSAFLLAAAVRALGAQRVVAGTGLSASLAAGERAPARAFAESLGVRYLTPVTHEGDRAGYRENSTRRCWFCKDELLEVLTALAGDLGVAHVATGTNADDVVAGFRPGIAAARDRGAITPLADAGFTKAMVREASLAWALPTWDKPAAACLASRVAYGVEVTPWRLVRVDRAERAVREVLARAGTTSDDLRVRDLDGTASVELDVALLPLPGPLEQQLHHAVRDAGFSDVVVDPRGFRSGALNDGHTDPTG